MAGDNRFNVLHMYSLNFTENLKHRGDVIIRGASRRDDPETLLHVCNFLIPLCVWDKTLLSTMDWILHALTTDQCVWWSKKSTFSRKLQHWKLDVPQCLSVYCQLLVGESTALTDSCKQWYDCDALYVHTYVLVFSILTVYSHFVFILFYITSYSALFCVCVCTRLQIP